MSFTSDVRKIKKRRGNLWECIPRRRLISSKIHKFSSIDLSGVSDVKNNSIAAQGHNYDIVLEVF